MIFDIIRYLCALFAIFLLIRFIIRRIKERSGNA